LLELGTREVVPPINDDEASALELIVFDDDTKRDMVLDTDAVEGSVEFIVRLDVTRIGELVTVEGTAVVAVLLDPDEKFDDGVVDSPLCPRLERLEAADAELLECVNAEELGVGLPIISEVIVIVVVCPTERVLMKVIKPLHVVDGTKEEGVTAEDGLMTITDVLVSVVVSPPGIVLVSVIIASDVRRESEVDVYPVDMELRIEVLVLVAIDPPGMLLVGDERLLEVVGATGLVEPIDPLTTEVEIVVKVVVCPPDVALMSVINTVEVVSTSVFLVVPGGTPPVVVEVILVRVAD
jgi:hypothetical protein